MKSWKKAIQKTKQAVESYEETVDTEDAGGVSKINTLLEDRKDEGKMTYMGDVLTKEANKEVDDSCLKPDQHRAYSIIISHLRAELQGQKPTQLLMLLTGEGGTGKSKVIQMVTETFDDLGAHSQLLKGAYTGIAACTIGGTTLHSLCGVPVKGKQPSTTTLNKLILMWQNVRYLIIDEYSMISRSFLTRISSTLSLVMDRVRGYAEDLAFGGLNVIISGDFHQFPPVCSRKSAPLYWRPSTDDTNEESVGSELYLKFNKVVILKDQVRVTDEGWLDLLRHICHGTCSTEHISILRTLLLGSSKCPDTDFTCRPWSNAVLVTPRHSVHNQWNIAASKERSIAMKTQLYVSYAEDTIQN